MYGKDHYEASKYPKEKIGYPDSSQHRNPEQFYSHVSSKKEYQKSQYEKAPEVTRLEAEALYWKLLAPLNYKMLEGKYILVCPICDKDLGLSQDRMVYRRHFELEALYGKKTQKTHIAECEVIAEA